MLENIQGEESPSFANATGKAVSICVGATEEETTACLLQVLESEYEDAAKALAAEVHRVVEFHKEIHEDLPQLPEMDYEQFGIWIDPIGKTKIFSIFCTSTKISKTFLCPYLCRCDCRIYIGRYNIYKFSRNHFNWFGLRYRFNRSL